MKKSNYINYFEESEKEFLPQLNRLKLNIRNSRDVKIHNTITSLRINSYSMGRIHSNITRDLMGESFYSIENSDHLYGDIRKMEEEMHITKNKKRILNNIFKRKTSVKNKGVSNLIEFENVRRNTIHDYTKRWIMYNKLFQNHKPEIDSR